MVPFAKLTFGFVSAEIESAESPELLLDAFLDRGNVADEVLQGRRAIVLGVKGSGKSAIGLHLSLLSRQRHDLFVKQYSLGDLSFTHLGRLVRPDLEPDIKYPQAWEWVLLLALLESLTRDHALASDDPSSLEAMVRLLQQEGLLPGDSLIAAANRSRLDAAEFSLWGFKLERKKDAVAGTMSAAIVVSHLRNLLASTRTPNRHIIIIDGLDDVQAQGPERLYALSGLLLQATRINAYCRERLLPYKIVVLARTDLFERLPGANMNKLKQDMAVELDWYVEADDPRQSPLVGLAKLRARHADHTVDDLFRQYFPPLIDRRSPEKHLLEYSRHTPRDFLQTLVFVQRAGDPREWYPLRAGLRSYSEKYFLGEIADELDSQFDRAQIERLIELLRRFRRPEFREQALREFMESPENAELKIDLRPMLAALYRCGGIGNVFQSAEAGRRYTFRYRNPTSSFNPGEVVVVHKGLRRVLDLVYGGPGT